MPDVVTFGEIMLRLMPPGHLRLTQAPHFEITFGGAEANVAVMIAQLGGSAGYVTRLPANDLPRLAELRRTLRTRMETSVLMDAPRFARNIETAYRAMWRRRCAESAS
jgi:sugar/nucleoside kinase (ribokinase family)